MRGLRAGSLACVAALWLGVRALVPDPAAQRDALLVVALGLGYGHQLGALLFGRWRRRPASGRLLLCATLLSLCCAFGLALASIPSVLLLPPLALLAAWHVLENEVAIARFAAPGVRLPPLPRAARSHLAVLAGALALVLALALATRCAPWLAAAGFPVRLLRFGPEEILGALLLHHSLVWLARSLRAAPERRLAILAIHALPVLGLGLVLAHGPAALAFVASPALYLSLSAAHALHTSFERGLESA
jgi:hypothetical protein